MSSSADDLCPGLSSNPDISGPGVRIALYLQSLLSVLLVRYSPKDAPGAYWSMTSTAFSLIISSIVTAAAKEISLLDAIVVVYVLLLPILASAFGLTEIMSPQSSKKSTRSVHSPLLTVANWMRSAFTYSFALYVWISAPEFGQGPRACNEATFFIFFGASLPALRSGRWLNIAVWSLMTTRFVWRSGKSAKTLFVSLNALFSKTATQRLLKPRYPPKNEIHEQTVWTKDYGTGQETLRVRRWRPRQIFHELIQSLTSQILNWAPFGTGALYKRYGQNIIISMLAVWAIVMTELQLSLNNQGEINNEWGFGQILPLVLTISPLFSLWESFISRQSSGPASKSRKIRFSIRAAQNLTRPMCELDFWPPTTVDEMTEGQVAKARAPSAFAVITIDERDVYTTFEAPDNNCPVWNESFDIEVTDLSTIVVRVFDRKCIDMGWPSFIGYTTIHPFTVFPHASHSSAADVSNENENETIMSSLPSGKVDVDSIPLVLDDYTMHNMTISISISPSTEEPVNLPGPTSSSRLTTGPRKTKTERRAPKPIELLFRSR
ncbi:E3 ubiquitin-protein ligase pub1 [Psilocybe cubensis]|uniref:E3 ubiquitin-protein ligase pub1 n=2 Tax=Psilocybe cubensis TaxID=181762 RepID=A0ACB8GFM6_PSICU|nr:E3 ubiquitin-protein ligase pub1 [Psilocybe cubensis]KAH9474441.1 E3 ubiquitin-protein ligase pub1 [Psilocybe cubensis]